MTGEEQILERLAKIEEKLSTFASCADQLKNFTNVFENMHDLGRDMSLLMSPTVNLLTEELAEVETGFQLEDALFLLKRLLLSFRHLAWGLEQMENLIDWWQDMEPVLKLAVPHLIDLMDNLEQKGIFRINKAMIEMYGKIAEHYTPEDIDAIGDGFVRMHGIIKKLSDPRVIEFLDRFMEVPVQVNLEAARPVGPIGLMFRMMNKESKEGLGVALELTKALGKLRETSSPPAGEGGTA